MYGMVRREVWNRLVVGFLQQDQALRDAETQAFQGQGRARGQSAGSHTAVSPRTDRLYPCMQNGFIG